MEANLAVVGPRKLAAKVTLVESALVLLVMVAERVTLVESVLAFLVMVVLTQAGVAELGSEVVLVLLEEFAAMGMEMLVLCLQQWLEGLE